MLVSEIFQARLAAAREEAARGGSLPRTLKRDESVRTQFLRRLSASRAFALGAKAGTLRTAHKRSGRAFRLDTGQRVIVKALVSRHMGAQRGAALAKHVAYIARSGAGQESGRPEIFSRDADSLDARAHTRGWADDRHHFRLIVSPEHADRIRDLRGYVREVMGRVAADLGERGLDWLAANHFDTDNPHAHVLIRGRRADGRDLVIPRQYVGYGIRARAQEVAQELSGDLSRHDAEKRIWREVEANRFTGFDRRLLAARDEHGLTPDGVGGGDSWAALTRGRLRYLERLGLVERVGRAYRLDPELGPKLRGLQLRHDVIRTLNLRRLEGARDVREIGPEPVRGVVVKSGCHDELGARH